MQQHVVVTLQWKAQNNCIRTERIRSCWFHVNRPAGTLQFNAPASVTHTPTLHIYLQPQHLLFHRHKGHRLDTVKGVLLSINQSSGTGFWPLSTTVKCRWTVSAKNWRHSTPWSGMLVAVFGYKSLQTTNFQTKLNQTPSNTLISPTN